MRHTPHKSNGYTYSAYIKGYYKVKSVLHVYERVQWKKIHTDSVGYRVTQPDIEVRYV